MSNSTIQTPTFRGWPTVEGGIPISDNHTVASINEAIANLGREVGRIGTVLETTSDPALLANFMALYAACLQRYADLLLKQKILTAEGDIATIIAEALDAINDDFALDL